MFIWIILVVLNFVVPKISFSEQENRYLAKIPKFSFEKLVSGEYQEALDSYINDHFIFRNSWIRIKSQQERILGKTEYNGVIFGKEGYYLRPRFSPGYGDFSIEHQYYITRMIDSAKTIGLTITDSLMMTPTKSVTAVIGLSTSEENCHRQGCEACSKKDCIYRSDVI